MGGRGGLGIRQKSAMQWRVVRTAAMAKVGSDDGDHRDEVFQRIASLPRLGKAHVSLILPVKRGKDQ